MRAGQVLLGFCLVVSAPRVTLAQAPVPVGSQVATVHVDAVVLTGVQSEKLTFTTRLALFPERTVTVKSLSFSAMTVNGMPVYVGPLTGRFALKKGEPLRLPDVAIDIYTRDLATLGPLRSLIEQGKVAVAGEVLAEIDGNLFQDLAMGTLHPRAVMPFRMAIPMEVPGGSAGRTAALGTLDLLEVAGPAARLLGAFLPGQDAGWRADLLRDQVRHVVLVKTSCVVVDGKNSYPLNFEQLGFWIGPSTVMVTQEAVKPWEFDIETLAMLRARRAHVDERSMTMSVQPVKAVDGGSAGLDEAAWTLAAGDFTIATEGKPPAGKVIYAPSNDVIDVRGRASNENYALLRFRDGNAGSPAVSASPAENGWDRLGVFRLVRDQAGDSVQVEVVFVAGTAVGRQIEFGQPIDELGYGSPVFSADGVIAIAQDETHATMLGAIKHLDEKTR